jgi:hypothetical protein
MRIGAAQARARVEAHLGRPPQDALEAAVVLEAWGGMRARSALELGTAVVENGPSRRPRPPRQGVPPAPAAAPRAQGLALATALLATVTWTTPLMRTFGVATFQQGWHVALPVSLGVQWLLQRRSLGALALPRRWWAAAGLLGAIALAAGASSALAPGAVLAVALALTWLAVLVVVQRGWGFPYAAIIAAGGVVMRLGSAGAVADLVLMLVVSLTGLGAAAWRPPAPTRRPAPWRLAVLAGLAGATVGLLIALGARGPFAINPDLAVLALMPALVGMLWSARHLTRLWELSRQPLLGRPRRTPLARRLLAGAFVRLSAGTGFLSLLVLALGALRHENVHAVASLLATASGMGLTGLLVALLEAFGRQGWALSTAALTAAPLLLRAQGIVFGTHGQTVLASVLMGLLVSVWTVRYFLEDPHRSLVVATL